MKQSVDVTVDVDDSLATLIDDLRETAANPPWGSAFGLAAPQIGRSLRVFIALGEVFINPIVLKIGSKIRTEREWCYSLPMAKVGWPVRRAKIVKLQWFEYGTARILTRKFHRIDAQVIQHEMDHLNGILINNHRTIQNLSKND
jgi:peptide deformylase